MKSSVNIRLFRNGSVLVRISLVPYKYVPIYMCIVKDTFYIRIRICAQQLKYMKIRRKMKNEVCCVLFTVHQFPWGVWECSFLLQLLSAGFAGLLRHLGLKSAFFSIWLVAFLKKGRENMDTWIPASQHPGKMTSLSKELNAVPDTQVSRRFPVKPISSWSKFVRTQQYHLFGYSVIFISAILHNISTFFTEVL